jgi:hypothetical protein
MCPQALRVELDITPFIPSYGIRSPAFQSECEVWKYQLRFSHRRTQADHVGHELPLLSAATLPDTLPN